MLSKPVVAPRGWNSWDCYGAAVTEEIVRKNARFMADNLKEFGWEYVVVDIQWYEPNAKTHEYNAFTELCMDEYSRLIPAENRFPSASGGKGFAPLADYVHSLGLKFGIHMMRGIPRQAVHQNTAILGSDATARQIAKTDSICHWNTDMYGVNPEKKGAKEYYESIFKLYASWGVDFIKCDDIARELPHEEAELVMLSDALKSCDREMVLSLSPGPAILERSEFYKQVANMWRITDDFWDKWELLYDMFTRCEKWSIHTGVGSFPDTDMLPIGPIRQDYDVNDHTQFTEDEQITMMTLWSIFRAPLFIGGEMTKFDDFTMSLITNENIMKLHRNARNSHQVWRRIYDGVEYILWIANSIEGGTYIAIFNTGDKSGTINLDMAELELSDFSSALDLWNNITVSFGDTMSVKLNSHGAKVFLF
ncbi:MAG: glycoside hydrolase family 27 protein [Wujia sp.]